MLDKADELLKSGFSNNPVTQCNVPDCMDYNGWFLKEIHQHTIVKETKNDPVNHPKHYTSHLSGVECIQITRYMNFNLGNVVKYLWRNGLKDKEPSIQDLEKAAWYLNDEIKERKKNNGQTT